MTAERDLREKMRLEAQLKPKIQQYHKRIHDNFVSLYAKSGDVMDLQNFDDELSDILNGHYTDVSAQFDSLISDNMPDDVAVTEEEKDAIAAALALYYLAQSRERATDINATTQRDIHTSIQEAEQDDMVRAEIGRDALITAAVLAGVYLARRLNARAPGIVTTETQMAAETAKATEAEILSGLSPSIVTGDARQPEVKKEWVTVGDSRVRPAHIAADGQTVGLNDVYIVNGERLRWPGDTSLGASAGNVINCRCSSVIQESDIVNNRRERL